MIKRVLDEYLPYALVIGGAVRLFWQPSWAALEFWALSLAYLALKDRWTVQTAFTALKGDVSKVSAELDKLKTAISVGNQRKF